jgi:hypothetical protein
MLDRGFDVTPLVDPLDVIARPYEQISRRKWPIAACKVRERSPDSLKRTPCLAKFVDHSNADYVGD